MRLALWAQWHVFVLMKLNTRRSESHIWSYSGVIFSLSFFFFFLLQSFARLTLSHTTKKKSAQRYYQRIFKRAEGSHCSACWECAVTCFTSVLHFRNLAGDLNPPLLFGFSSNCREISLEEIHFLPIGVLLAVVWEIHVCCSVWAAQNRTENVKW